MRLERKKRSWDDLGLKMQGQITNLFDNQFKSAYRINDAEMDFICEKMTDDEMQIIITENPTFSEKRKCLEILNKYLKDFVQ